ncbi:MAG: hypothetical protein LBC61_07075 [Candidatus Peribacteria bacterium]|nr:hypothetical protein [Candidatus Peribacteria bacterium]
MEELMKEISRAFKEKISSPFFRYFIFSWCLINYKVVYFIFFQNQEIFYKVHNITKFDFLMNFSFYNSCFYNSCF